MRMGVVVVLLSFGTTAAWAIKPIGDSSRYASSPAKRCINSFRTYYNEIANGRVSDYKMKDQLRYIRNYLDCVKKADPKIGAELQKKLDAITAGDKKRAELKKTILTGRNCVLAGFSTWRDKTKYTAGDVEKFKAWLKKCNLNAFTAPIAAARKDSSLSKDRGVMGYAREIDKAKGAFPTMASNQAKAVDALVKKAKADYAKIPLIALEAAQGAMALAKASASAVPNNASAKTALAQAKKGLDDIVKGFSKYHVSPFHKENAGKIFLSTAPIPLGKEDPSAFKKAFKANDKMFVVGYEMTRMMDYIGPTHASVWVTLKKDGKQIAHYRKFAAHDDKVLKQAYLTFEVLPGDVPPGKIVNAALSYKIVAALAKLGPGKHKLALDIGVDAKNTPRFPQFADVEFEFENTGGIDLARLAKVYGKEALDRVRMPARGKKDKKLERKMLKAITTNKEWKEKPLRAVITGDGFDLNRHKLSGAVMGRHIWGAVAVKRKNGTCTIFRIRFYQTKKSRGWEAPILGMVAGNEDINCKNVKK